MDSGLTREKQSESRECCRQVKVPSVYFPPHLQFHCHGRGVSANFNGRAQFAASSWRAAERAGQPDHHHRLPSQATRHDLACDSAATVSRLIRLLFSAQGMDISVPPK